MTIHYMTRGLHSGLRSTGLILSVLVALLASSCRSGRNAGGETGGAYVQQQGALSQAELKILLSQLEGSYEAWEDVRIPVTLRLRSPKKMSIGGTLSMKRDSYVHLSLRFLGMEVASMMATQDSIYGLYKPGKLYVAESISDLLGGFPATVGNVQDLLLGRVFALGGAPLSAAGCSLSGDRYSWTVTASNPPKGMGYSFTVASATGNVERLTVSLPSRKPIEAEYSDFTTSPSGPMAAAVSVTASGAKTEVSAEVDLNPRRAEWNTGGSRSWTAPKGYRRVTADAVMKIISAL